MNKKEMLIVVSILFIVLITILVLIPNNENKKEDNDDYPFKIHFFDVGKADSMIISYDNTYTLIDTAEEKDSSKIIEYLIKNNINKIDYLILTHFDKDHVGGASNIIDNFEVEHIYISNYPKDSEYYNKYIDSVNKKDIRTEMVTGNNIIDIIDKTDYKMYINGPSKVFDKDSSNNSSLIVGIKYKDNSFLFMGDAQNDRIEEYIELDDNEYDFIKMPYHGNHLKRNKELINKYNFQYAVITSSDQKPEDDRTIELLNDYRIDYYLTRNGSIDVYSNGKNIKIVQ